MRIWDTDVSDIPVWKTLTFKVSPLSGIITLKSALVKAVENRHGRPYDTVVSELEDRFTQFCNNSDKYLIPILLQFFSERRSEIRFGDLCIVEVEDLKGYLESEWWKLWEFLPENEEKKTVCQIRGLGSSLPKETIGGYGADWSQAMCHEWGNSSKDYAWAAEFSADLLGRLLDPSTFFHRGYLLKTSLTEKHKPGRRGKSLPPFVPGIWRLCAHRFDPDQAHLVGICNLCIRKPGKAYTYYSQFQYALHLYAFHTKSEELLNDIPIKWNHAVDPAEYAITREQLLPSFWRRRRPIPRVVFRNFYCRKDEETGELYLADHETYDPMATYYINFHIEGNSEESSEESSAEEDSE